MSCLHAGCFLLAALCGLQGLHSNEAEAKWNGMAVKWACISDATQNSHRQRQAAGHHQGDIISTDTFVSTHTYTPGLPLLASCLLVGMPPRGMERDRMGLPPGSCIDHGCLLPPLPAHSGREGVHKA
eukprot:1138063-Pelagomonas_calceolata.AAC.11